MCFPNQSSSSDEIPDIVKLCNGTPSDLRSITKDFKADMKRRDGRSVILIVRKCISDTFPNGTSLVSDSVTDKLSMRRIMFPKFSEAGSISDRNASDLSLLISHVWYMMTSTCLKYRIRSELNSDTARVVILSRRLCNVVLCKI